jgi:hypothetical protein
LVKHFIRYKRRPGQSLLDAILDGFALVTFGLIAKEYFETLKIASEPIEQPDANQKSMIIICSNYYKKKNLPETHNTWEQNTLRL